MSKNLTRKGLALGTALAFVVTGLTATAPANAAAGDTVKIAPTTGTGYGVYNNDKFSTDITIDTDVVTTSSYNKLALKIDNTSGNAVTLKLSEGINVNAGSTAVDSTNAHDVSSVCNLEVRYTDDSGNVSSTTTAAGTATCAGGADAAANSALAVAQTFTLSGFTTTYTHAVIELNADVATPVTATLGSNDGATTTKIDNVAIKLTAWIDSDEDEELESTDKFPSTTETITFYDPENVSVTPRIERFVDSAGTPRLNGHDSKYLGASLSFSPALNLDQTSLASSAFTFALKTQTSVSTTVATTFISQREAGKSSLSASGKIYGLLTGSAGTNAGDRTVGVPAANASPWTAVPTAIGGTSTDTTPVVFASLDAGRAYTLAVTRLNANASQVAANTNDGTEDRTSTTAGYTVPSQATAGITAITKALVDQTSDSTQASNTDTAIKLRAGVKTFKYTTEGTFATGATASNVPVIAVVTAADLATGSTLTAGSTKLSEGEAALVSGVTDADGKFTVTVESSSAKAGEDYTVVFYALLNDGSYANSGTFAPVYETAAASKMAQDSAILAGSTVTAKFSLEDQFGKAISANASGTAYTVRLQAPDTTKLKKFATFSNGAATISFTNYLAKGQSDSLTAALGTGVDTAFVADTAVSGRSQTPALYNPEAAAAVTTSAAAADKAITYDAFITGTADAATNVAPAAADAFQLTGTVVDTTGAGIPGAVVTVSAAGLQFVKSSSGTASGDYFKDSITVVADTAGAYEVSVWAHKVTSTGITITTTAGGKTATTKLTTVGNGWSTGSDAEVGTTGIEAGDITANDLVFTWTAPAHPGVDTTYIVTGKVTDKWGNGINAAKVTIAADGALEVNGQPSVDRVTSASGTFRVFFRSLPKVDGVANITATLKEVVVSGTKLDTDATTKQNATASAGNTLAAVSELTASGLTFVNVLTSDVNVGVDAVAVAGSKAGTAKATVYNAKGKTVVVYVAGKKVATKKATSAAYSVTVKAKAGAVVKVVVGSTTYFNSSVN